MSAPAYRARTLRGQRALVTGAGRGIGRGIALRLAEEGVDLCLAARTESELAESVRLAAAHGVHAFPVVCDITAPGEVEGLVDTAAAGLGGLNILVNNAGGAHRMRDLADLDDATFALGTALNYESVHRAMRAAAPHLFRAAPQAAVLNVVSIAALRAQPMMSYYGAAKAAVIALSRGAAREWGPKGVRVNCLAPGWISTDLSRPLRDDPEFSERILDQVPLGRWGEVEEIADAAAFLVSDSARYVTGATLAVDGGFLT